MADVKLFEHEFHEHVFVHEQKPFTANLNENALVYDRKKNVNELSLTGKTMPVVDNSESLNILLSCDAFDSRSLFYERML